jgi:predicted GIY-YIG superfamily endonuclease
METIWYVYELYNLTGTIEHVGETINTERRFNQHTKWKRGKFYGRTDISMNIVKEFDNLKEAWNYQCVLQKEYGLKTDSEAMSRYFSKETKLKISKAKVGNEYWKGKTH